MTGPAQLANRHTKALFEYRGPWTQPGDLWARCSLVNRRLRRCLGPVIGGAGADPATALAAPQYGVRRIVRVVSPPYGNALSGGQEVFDCDTSHAKKCAESALCHVASVARYSYLSTGPDVTPDFMASRTRSIKQVAQVPQAPRNVSVLEASQASH